MADLAMAESSPQETESTNEAMVEDQHRELTGGGDVDMDEMGHMEERGHDHALNNGHTQIHSAFWNEKQDTEMNEDDHLTNHKMHTTPAFRSPPAVQTLDDDHAMQALGHAVEDAERRPSSSPNPPPPPPPPTSTEAFQPAGDAPSEASDASRALGRHQERREGDTEDVLLTQDQDRDEGRSHQAQAIEKQGRHHAALTEEQSLGQAADADEQRLRVDIEQVKHDDSEEPELRVDTEQENKPDASRKHRQLNQINEVRILRRDENCASCTSSSGPLKRPYMEKSMLADVRFGDEDDGETLDIPLSRSPIQLTYDGVVYALFRSTDSDEGEVELPVLLEDESENSLYLNQLEHLFVALHRAFPSFEQDSMEMTLEFTDLSLEISEDSVYTREMSLYDLDRILVAAEPSANLRLTLKESARMVFRFNQLASHVAGIMSQRKGNSDEVNIRTYDADADDAVSNDGSDAAHDNELLDEGAEEGHVIDEGAAETAYEVAAEDDVEPIEVLEGAEDVGLPGGADDDEDDAAEEPDATDGAEIGLSPPNGTLVGSHGDGALEASFYADALEGDEALFAASHDPVTAASASELPTQEPTRESSVGGVPLTNGALHDALATDVSLEPQPVGVEIESQRKMSSPKRSRASLPSVGDVTDLPESKRPRAV